MKPPKQLLAVISLITLSVVTNAQNTYPWPSSGNIGIGTTTPGTIGGACKTLGINSSTDQYSGGVSYMANDVTKGFTYFDAGAMTIQGTAGVPVKIITDNIEQARIDVNGNIGIGTATPGTIGTACKTLAINSSTDQYSGGVSYMANGVTKGFTYYDYGAMTIQGTAGVPVKILTDNSERVRIDVNGNVGIGTTVPGAYKLSVNGNVKAKKIVVTQTDWPDYVFHPSYNLRPLAEVAQFIITNQHLPDVPSAKEVEEKGVNLGDSQALLLKKIEELTLYMIDINKQLQDERTKNNQLEQKMSQLETRIK